MQRPFNLSIRSARFGATLTEVLMAIFIMSIGVVSVITLFPLAILRAVHATQLTNSKVLEENVKEFIYANQWILRGSPVDTRLDPGNATDVQFQTACVIDPLGKPILQSYAAAYGRQFGNTGGGSVPTWAIRRISPFAQLTLPPGWTATAPSYMATGANVDWPATDHSWMDSSVCALPDSWTTLTDDLPDNITSSVVTFPTELAGVGTEADPARLTLISSDGTRSLVRRVRDIINTDTEYSSPDRGKMVKIVDTEQAISGGFGLGFVGRAVVERNEARYSWIITCPIPAAAPPAATCAIFFRRSFDPEEEVLYDNGGTAPFTANSATVNIQWTSTRPTPLVREGNYLFDAENALWYRIRSYTMTESGGAGSATIELDQPARAAGSGLMLPHGLVHKFDLELRGQQ